VANARLLQVAKRRNYGNNHLLQFILFPEDALLLALSEKIFEVGAGVHVLTDHGDAVCVVHRFVEVVPVELKDVGVRLHFEKLDGFFLFAIKFQLKALPCIRLAYREFSLQPP